MRQQVPASPPGSHEPAVPAQEHQPLGLRDGKLAQEGLVHEREDRRVRTDAEPIERRAMAMKARSRSSPRTACLTSYRSCSSIAGLQLVFQTLEETKGLD